MSSYGSNTTNQTTTATQGNEPWGPIQPYIMQGLDEARNAFNGDPGTRPFSDWTMRGLEQQSRVGSDPDVMAARGAVGSFAAGQGMGAGQDLMAALANGGFGAPPGAATYQGLTGAGAGQDAGAMGIFRGLGGAGAGTDTQGMDVLRRTAGGEFLNGNPFFQQMVDQSIMAARPGVDAAFAGSGRLGSGAHAAAFADAATRRGTELGYANYESERGRQLQAGGLLNDVAARSAGINMQAGGALDAAAARSAGINLQAGAGLNQGWAQDAQQRLAGANALSGASAQDRAQQMQASGMVPGLAGIGTQGLLGAGGAMDARQRLVDNDSWDRLGQFSGLLSGYGAGRGQQTTTTQTPVTAANPWMQGIGVASAGLGAANQLYQLGGPNGFNWWGGLGNIVK